jgi:general secretion pathway protein I
VTTPRWHKIAGSPHARGRRPAAPAAGFSLIEVLAAFVVLALVATALFELFGGALRNAAAADDWSRAVLVAESRLAEAASTRPLQEGAERGEADDGRIKWESRVTPWEAPAVDPELARVSETMATRLWRVEVDVTFPGLARGDRKFSLATVRIAEKDAK